jgi:hypothetical protein
VTTEEVLMTRGVARVVLPLLCAGTFVSPAAHAAAGCVVLTDPPGDVVIDDTAPTQDGNLDLRAVTVRRTRTALVVSVDVTDLDPNAVSAGWGMRFKAGGQDLVVGASSRIAQPDLPMAPHSASKWFFAGPVSDRRDVTGTINQATNRIEIVAPFAAFAAARLTRTSTLTNVTAYGRVRWVVTGTDDAGVLGEVRTDDTAARATPLALARC